MRDRGAAEQARAGKGPALWWGRRAVCREGAMLMVWKALTRALASRGTIFVMGAASAAVLKAVAPAIGNVARPLLREAIKGGILLGRQVQTVVQEAWQEVEDITAEAKAEMDQSQDGAPPAHAEQQAL